MVTETFAWLAIVLMGLVALLTRVAGVSLARWMPSTPFWQRFFAYLPGTLLLSIAVPSFLSGDLAVVTASSLVLVVAMFRVNLVIAMVVGIATVALLRAFV